MSSPSTDSTPAFSIVIPAYNVAGYIDETIQSVLRQTVQDWELIVVDDGSTDDTAERVKAVGDARIRLIRQENSGVSVARNTGIAAARGRYVALLDADDLWAPSHLLRAKGYFEAYPKGQWYVGKTSADVKDLDLTATQWDYHEVNYFTGTGGVLPNSSSVIVSRSLLGDQPHLFPPGIRYAEDLMAWMRLACRAPFFGSSAGVSVYYRVREGSAMVARPNPRRWDMLEAERLYPLYDQLVLPEGHEEEARHLIHLRFVERWRCVIAETALKGYEEIVDRRRQWTGPLFSAWVKLFLFLLRVLVWAFKQPMQHYLNHHRSH